MGKKYFREADLAPPTGEDLRPMVRPKAGKVLAARPAGRRPTSQAFVKDELVKTLGQFRAD